MKQKVIEIIYSSYAQYNDNISYFNEERWRVVQVIEHKFVIHSYHDLLLIEKEN